MQKAVVSVLHNWGHDDYDVAKKEILSALGNLDGFEVWGQQVLVADYMRPATTRGGIIMSEESQQEDVFQGKVAMIVKVSPDAFSVEDLKRYNGRLPQVGDWVFNRVQDSFQLSLKGAGSVSDPARGRQGWPCRLVYAGDLYGRVDDPSMIV